MKHLLLFIFIARGSFVVAQPCNQNPETESLWGNKHDGNANPATNATIFMYNIDNTITSTSYSAFWCEPVGDKYFEIFTDEFDRGYLDNDHWITKMRWNDDCPYSDQNSFVDGSTPPENQSYLSSDNVEVASGHCNLHYYYSPDYNFKLNSSNTCGNVTTPIDLGYTYTASAIFSKWLFPEGRFEIRCKVPSNNYTNPAFWLW